jgi:hypothetical protein
LEGTLKIFSVRGEVMMMMMMIRTLLHFGRLLPVKATHKRGYGTTLERQQA